jgi:hypothetical protein
MVFGAAGVSSACFLTLSKPIFVRPDKLNMKTTQE